MRHLIDLVEELRQRGIGFKSICDGVIDTTTASGELVFHIFTALAQFERRLIQERTNAGLAALLSSAGAPSAKAVIEASVHLPKRGRRWVASYRDGTGQQRWKSTGVTDRRAALIVAQKLEQAARRAQAEHGEPDKPVVRARPGGTGLTQKDVATLLGMSERGVRAVERRALEKLRRHPALRAIWRELVDEGAASTLDPKLTDAEIAAVYRLAPHIHTRHRPTLSLG
jgi:hypothetical protein